MEKIAYIAVAGALGTLARYGFLVLFQRQGYTGLPWGIFFANMLGAFLFGFIWAALEERGVTNENLRAFALVGFMGAFTTFSTFAFENVQMARSSEWGWFATNMIATNFGGLVCIYVGFKLARVI